MVKERDVAAIAEAMLRAGQTQARLQATQTQTSKTEDGRTECSQEIRDRIGIGGMTDRMIAVYERAISQHQKHR